MDRVSPGFFRDENGVIRCLTCLEPAEARADGKLIVRDGELVCKDAEKHRPKKEPA